jgi:hypothetical protein
MLQLFILSLIIVLMRSFDIRLDLHLLLIEPNPAATHLIDAPLQVVAAALSSPSRHLFCLHCASQQF